ncbi:hypothetical protein RND71_021120 [Anisodus tanguticus]|uniref:Uncharacterized protein n=1 Tax=Anisodus tanguticus TaxID=243964 RepID=A0AAE1RVY5_9SOLA|nr:hypothetical protein RND71_021120 [Anisodus tanguticus]
MPTPRLSQQQQQQYEFFGLPTEIESDPDLRPKIISEEFTRLRMRQAQRVQTENRVISFKGDHNGNSIDKHFSFELEFLNMRSFGVVQLDVIHQVLADLVEIRGGFDEVLVATALNYRELKILQAKKIQLVDSNMQYEQTKWWGGA